MKIKDLDIIINEILVDETKKLIKEQAQEEMDGKKILFDTIKGFQSLSGMVDKISNIEDISDEQHDLGLSIHVNGISKEELIQCCGGTTVEEAEKNLMQGLHMDLEEKDLGSNMDIDIDIEGDDNDMNLKINIKSSPDSEKLGSEMSENSEMDEMFRQPRMYDNYDDTMDEVKNKVDEWLEMGKIDEQEHYEMMSKIDSEDLDWPSGVGENETKHILKSLARECAPHLLKKKKKETENMENQEPMEQGNAFLDALNTAKEEGKDTFVVDGEEYNVEESWKQLEEEEMSDLEETEEPCEQCGSKSMNEQQEFDDFDTQIQPEEMTDYSSLDDAQEYFNSVTNKEGEMTEGDGEETCEQCGSGLMSEGECMECGSKSMKEGDGEETCEQCGSGLMSEGECMECGSKSMNESKVKSYKLTESKLIDMITNIVESIPGLDAVKNSHKEANNDEYLNSVDKKLKNYLSFDGNDNPEFPKQIGKGEKMAVNNTDEEDEFVEDNRGGGMQHLEYDNKPSPEFVERLKKALSGDSTMGNAQDKDVANVVPSDLGEKMAKQVKRKYEKDLKAPMYLKDPAPSVETKPGKKESMNESVVKKTDPKVLEEIKRIKNMSLYNNKTQ